MFAQPHILHIGNEAIRELKPQAAESFATGTEYRGWAADDIPVTYLACDQDQALLLNTDVARFLKRFETADLKDFTQRNIDCDHSPWMSAENEFTKVMAEALEKASAASVA